MPAVRCDDGRLIEAYAAERVITRRGDGFTARLAADGTTQFGLVVAHFLSEAREQPTRRGSLQSVATRDDLNAVSCDP